MAEELCGPADGYLSIKSSATAVSQRNVKVRPRFLTQLNGAHAGVIQITDDLRPGFYRGSKFIFVRDSCRLLRLPPAFWTPSWNEKL